MKNIHKQFFILGCLAILCSSFVFLYGIFLHKFIYMSFGLFMMLILLFLIQLPLKHMKK